jgi:hypothetical protein
MMGSEYLLQRDSIKGAGGVADEEMLIQYKATGWDGPGAPRSMQVRDACSLSAGHSEMKEKKQDKACRCSYVCVWGGGGP